MPTLGISPCQEARATVPSRKVPGRRVESPVQADELSVIPLETDPSDGHPTLIHIDWIPGAIDDEECYRTLSYETYPTTTATSMTIRRPAGVHADS